MNKIPFREFLSKEIPDIDYRLIKIKTLQRIADYDRRRLRQGLYFVPKLGMSLLLILFTINIYSLIQEILYNLGMRGHGLDRLLTLPYLSLPFLFKAIAVFGDNLLAILVTLSLILLLDRRFFGIYKIYRLIKSPALFMWNLVVKLPTFALAILRGRHS